MLNPPGLSGEPILSALTSNDNFGRTIIVLFNVKQSVNYTTKRKRELAHCSLHELRLWQAHHVETNNFEAHADMIHLSLYRYGHPTLRRVPHR